MVSGVVLVSTLAGPGGRTLLVIEVDQANIISSI
jgi:hypothetical protein